ncbi:MAG TPA: exodeoxyribonuclease VII large subunit [Ktedonobacterales bacterium]|jgi:exodeoxyribonuclease VII large subunit
MQLLTVSQLTRYLKASLESDPVLQGVWVQGEVTNYSASSQGHQYFSLKDESAQMRCVFFRGAGSLQNRRAALFSPLGAASVKLRNGMAVLARGRLSIYETRGDYQLYVEEVEEAGVGMLHLRFEQLKQQLQDEGLFDEERKRPLPRWPQVVGIVTSPQAAALRDMLRVLRARCPLVRVILAPTLVQGERAPEQIAAALDLLNAQGEAEVILVSRGGGSLEELWAFNEEVVARAIARSRVPVISGVGHETDTTIADFVADYRASTPTAAAAAAVQDMAEWVRALVAHRTRLTELVEDHIDAWRDELARCRRDLLRASPRGQLASERQRLDEASSRLNERMKRVLEHRQERLKSAAQHLHALSPLQTIARGYAVIRHEGTGQLVTSVTQVEASDALDIQVRDGHIRGVVWHVLPDEGEL